MIGKDDRPLGGSRAYALIAGAGVGAILAASAFGLSMLPTLNEPGFDLKRLAGMTALSAAVAFVIWIMGLGLLGAPAWIWLHNRGYRSPLAAAGTGLALPFLTAMAFTLLGDVVPNGLTRSSIGGVDLVVDGRHTFAGWISVAGQGLLLGAAGVLVGMTIWRVAYRPLRARRHLLGWLLTISVFPAIWAVLPSAPADATCHNVMRGGERSVSAKFSVMLEIEGAERGELRRFFAKHGARERMDLRDRSSVTESMDALDLSLCTEAGPTIRAYDLRFPHADAQEIDRHVHVMVFQPRGGTWRSEAERLSTALERTFPGKVIYPDEDRIVSALPEPEASAPAR